MQQNRTFATTTKPTATTNLHFTLTMTPPPQDTTPSLTRRSYKEHADVTLFPFKWALSINSMIGVGVVLGSILPKRVAATAAAVWLGPSLVSAIGSRLGLRTDPLTAKVIKGRQTAKIKGDFVVFLIGARPNKHIDGFFKWTGGNAG
jgi:hypothetical protein